MNPNLWGANGRTSKKVEQLSTKSRTTTTTSLDLSVAETSRKSGKSRRPRFAR